MVKKMWTQGRNEKGEVIEPGQCIAVLTPDEFDSLLDVVKPKFADLLEVALYTGARYAELGRLKPEWFDFKAKTLEIPPSADRKVKRRHRGRNVHLSDKGTDVLRRYFRDKDRPKFPTIISWNYNLERWAKWAELSLGEASLCSKSFRKTWESWLAITFPEKLPLVSMSQGHTQATAMEFYLNLSFNKDEKQQIKHRVNGFMDYYL